MKDSECFPLPFRSTWDTVYDVCNCRPLFILMSPQDDPVLLLHNSKVSTPQKATVTQITAWLAVQS